MEREIRTQYIDIPTDGFCQAPSAQFSQKNGKFRPSFSVLYPSCFKFPVLRNVLGAVVRKPQRRTEREISTRSIINTMSITQSLTSALPIIQSVYPERLSRASGPSNFGGWNRQKRMFWSTWAENEAQRSAVSKRINNISEWEWTI